jgi:hypothetical protein
LSTADAKPAQARIAASRWAAEPIGVATDGALEAIGTAEGAALARAALVADEEPAGLVSFDPPQPNENTTTEREKHSNPRGIRPPCTSHVTSASEFDEHPLT